MFIPERSEPYEGGFAELKALTHQLTSLLKTSVPYSDVELEALYDIGVHLYQQGRWEDASRVFGAINLLAPFNSLYLIAQGKCLKCLEAYADAYEVFYLTWTIDKRMPEPALHAAECLMLSDQKDKAIELIHQIMEFPGMSEQDQALKDKAEAWLTLLTCGEANG